MVGVKGHLRSHVARATGAVLLAAGLMAVTAPRAGVVVDDAFSQALGSGYGTVFDVLPTADGSTFVAMAPAVIDNRLIGPVVKLDPGGSLDEAFRSRVLEDVCATTLRGSITRLLPAPDGGVYVVGLLFRSAENQTLCKAVLPSASAASDGVGGRGASVSAGGGGVHVPIGTDVRAAVHRITADGVLDRAFEATSFAPGGANTQFWLSVNDAAVTPDGGLLVAVGGGGSGQLHRITPQGRLDATFATNLRPGGGDPFTTTTSVGTVRSLAVLDDGHVVVAGDFDLLRGVTCPSNIMVLKADGSNDATWTSALGDGLGHRDPAIDASASRVAASPGGGFVVVGDFTAVGGNDLRPDRIARFRANGDYDTNFAKNAKDGLDGIPGSLVVLSSGKVLVAGAFSTVGATSVPGEVALIKTDGSVDATFAARVSPGFADTAVHTIRAVRVQPDGALLFGGSFATFNGVDVPSGLLRLATVPHAVSSLDVIPGDGSLTVSWAPGRDGGSAITGFTVSLSPNEGTCSPVTDTSRRCTGLTNGRAYRVTVTARNALGFGTAASALNMRPRRVPGAPTGVSATRSGQGRVLVAWTAPANDGGDTVSGYRVVLAPASGTCTVTGTTATCSGVRDGRSYQVSVAATNSAGRGAASPSVAVAMPAVRPGPVRSVRHTFTSAGAATVRWAGPAYNGGAPISFQTCRARCALASSWRGTGARDGQPIRTVSLGVVPPGEARTVRIRAVNSAGAGAAVAYTLGRPS